MKALNLPMTQIKEICDRNPIIELTLFGSILRDDVKSTSDIDILIPFCEPCCPCCA